MVTCAAPITTVEGTKKFTCVVLTYKSGASEVAPEESRMVTDVPPKPVGKGSDVLPNKLVARSVPYALASEPGASQTVCVFAEEEI
jgi:hypothetical protein